MMIGDRVRDLLRVSIKDAGFAAPREIPMEVPPADVEAHYASPVALSLAKPAGKAPRAVAEAIAEALRARIAADSSLPVASVELAGPGFINLTLGRSVLAAETVKAAEAGDSWGSFDELAGKRVLCEYSCPNPFKPLHVAHLMANSIGEALSRLYENAGAEVIRVTYGGDIGLHVAKAIWGMEQASAGAPKDGVPLSDRVRFVGAAYAAGAAAYDEKPEAKTVIDDLNARIFASKMSAEEKSWYDRGRAWSIEHFNDVYAAIGSHFDAEVWEREIEKRGKETVLANVGTVFEESEGAIVFRGERVGLHTRVFITAKGLPTYEAKDIGWALEKEDRWHPDLAVLETGAEQTQYFQVVQAALAEIAPAIPPKTLHVTHGLMRLADGKISSRKGNTMIALDLLEAAREKVREVLAEREVPVENAAAVANAVAVAAIKYQILKQSPGKDIVFDLDAATALDGDSGPYLQYAAVRASTLVKKAEEAGVVASTMPPVGEFASDLEMAIARLPEILRRAYRERAPQLVATHLVSLAAAFNRWYDTARVVGEEPKTAGWRLTVATAAQNAVSSGLATLGIAVPARM